MLYKLGFFSHKSFREKKWFSAKPQVQKVNLSDESQSDERWGVSWCSTYFLSTKVKSIFYKCSPSERWGEPYAYVAFARTRKSICLLFCDVCAGRDWSFQSSDTWVGDKTKTVIKVFFCLFVILLTLCWWRRNLQRLDGKEATWS